MKKNVRTLTLEEKIKAAEKYIHEAYARHNGKLFISFSGGKDSRILMDIALRLYPELPVVFSDTTNELSEIYRYVKSFKNVIWVRPKMSFFEVVAKHGFPLVSKENSQKIYELKHSLGEKTKKIRLLGGRNGNGKLPNKWRFLAEQEFDVTHRCCAILKKDPLRRWSEKSGRAPLIALMKDESRLRSQLALYGNFKKKEYPFLNTDWADKDIWEYADKFGIRFADCYYDQYKNGVFIPKKVRTGCEFCGFGIQFEKNRFERSKLVAPKRYEKAMRAENHGVTFKEAISLVLKDSLPKPRAHLYGYSIVKEDEDRVFLKPLHSFSKCPFCKSIDISSSRAQITVRDLPGRKKKTIVYKKFVCDGCGEGFEDPLPLVNKKSKRTLELDMALSY